MGRGLKVRRKSENLPVVGHSYTGVLASWDTVWLSGLSKLAFGIKQANRLGVWFISDVNRRSSRGDGGFFIGFFERPCVKGRIG